MPGKNPRTKDDDEGNSECLLSRRDNMIVARHEVPGGMRKIAPSQRDD